MAAEEKRTDGFVIGFSLCRTKLDKFDKEKGLEIAKGRMNQLDKEYRIPKSMIPDYIRFLERAQKYFKKRDFISNIHYTEQLTH